jgi:serine/threonine protein kinase
MMGGGLFGGGHHVSLPAAVPAPEQFGKYQLIERIATGGMAEIYRARLEAAYGITKPVVIKKILPHYANQQSFVKMFVNEAKIVVGLSHGNIAQVFDFGEIAGEYYLAMEYVHGQPLSRVLRKARSLELPALPVPFAVQIAIEVCKGLHYAHTRHDEAGKPLHIIHRDVSPQNILLSYEGSVKLVDFGIAKARNASVDTDTQSGAVKGKYVYFAPEQARGRDLDARADLFALGIVMYEMLTGRLPFEGKMMEVLKKIVTGTLAPPSTLNPAIPSSLEEIVLKALATDRRDRFSTAQEMQDTLSKWLYANAPAYSFSALGHLMEYLFEKELIEEGVPVRIPPDFKDRLLDWRGLQPGMGGATSAASPRALDRAAPVVVQVHHVAVPVTRPAPPERPDHDEDELTLSGIFPRLPLRLLMVALPLLAMFLAGFVVFAIGYFGSADVRLTSNPPGALVVVDGQPAPGVTPLRITGLDADVPHLIQVQAPGMKVWSGKVSLQRGSTLTVHAELEPLNAPPK